MKTATILLMLIASLVHGETNQSAPEITEKELINGNSQSFKSESNANSKSEDPKDSNKTSAQSEAEKESEPEPIVVSGRDGMPALLKLAQNNEAIQSVMDLGWDEAIKFYVDNYVYRMPTDLVEELTKVGVVVDMERGSAEIQEEIDEKERIEKIRLEKEEKERVEKQQQEEEKEKRKEELDKIASLESEIKTLKDELAKLTNKEDTTKKEDQDKDQKTSDAGEEEKSEPASKDTKAAAEPEKDPSKTQTSIAGSGDTNAGKTEASTVGGTATEAKAASASASNLAADSKMSEPKLYKVEGGQLIPLKEATIQPSSTQFSPDSNGVLWPSYVQPRVNVNASPGVVLPNTIPANSTNQLRSSPLSRTYMTAPTKAENTNFDWN